MSVKDPSGRLARRSLYLQIYEFEIIHRKGTKHTNVDALSRPVLMVGETEWKENENEDENTDNVQPDPYEDETLIHYLKYGRFPDGCSKKKIKRIMKIYKHFNLTDEELRYRKNVLDNEFKLVIPRREIRMDLIKKAHLLGHFQVNTTCERLKEDYYWRDMVIDTTHVVKNCLTCQRHQKTKILEHPALALPVESIFDKVGIDLVVSLPETMEGYKGILVITEYLSKYPYAVPIRTKTAIEIAEKFFIYIAMFGPPRHLISDQGTEFVNEIVKQLTKMSGNDHKISSADHPRTNGHCERFNQTLISALKKHSEEDPQKWNLWIPYVLMAYRTRIHSSSGFTPYELIFGRPMNTFEDWSEKSQNNELELWKRSVEIRQLVDKQLKAKERIADKQIIQIEKQNNAHNIQENMFKEGTYVMVKTAKKKSKLEAIYHGPFQVDSVTPKGNYWLKNNAGERLRQSIPLQRLKVVEKPDHKDDSYEVEKILQHKKRNGRLFYLVKWSNCPESDSTWEPESNFNTTECIEEYWQNLNAEKPSINS